MQPITSTAVPPGMPRSVAVIVRPSTERPISNCCTTGAVVGGAVVVGTAVVGATVVVGMVVVAIVVDGLVAVAVVLAGGDEVAVPLLVVSPSHAPNTSTAARRAVARHFTESTLGGSSTPSGSGARRSGERTPPSP